MPAQAAGLATTAASTAAPTMPALLGAFAIDAVLGIALLLVLQAVAVAVVAATLLLMPVLAGGAMPDPQSLLDGSMAEFTLAALVATAIAGALLWRLRGRRGEAWGPAMAPLPAYALAVLGGGAIQAGCLAIGAFAEAVGQPLQPSNAAPIAELGASYPWLAWSAVVLMAPLGEELLFRHVLLRRFALAGRAPLGLLLSTLPFALLHELDPTRTSAAVWLSMVALYLAMGLGFGAVYLCTRRFGAAFVAHATFNLLAMLLLAFPPS